MSEHILSRYDEQLRKLMATLVKMGSLAQEQLEFVLKALDTGDEASALSVIERDSKIDKYDLKIEKRCMNLFALQQPVAFDLRMIMSSLAMNRSLERIGDYTVNIARAVIDADSFAPLMDTVSIREMGQSVHSMLENALNAFVQSDPGLARQVIAADAEVDEFDRDNRVRLLDLMPANPAYIRSAAILIGVCRDLERIADEATNISEEVIFSVEATNIRHKHLDSVNPDETATVDSDEINDREPETE